jgi:hypothetical protein
LAYALFVEGQSEEELMTRYRCSLPGLKSAVAEILGNLVGRPLARKLVYEYLARVEQIEPMRTREVRRALKRMSPEQRAQILSRIPPCAWKVRDVMPLHKRLLLDYLSDEWVLNALVTHYNLQGDERLSGTFRHHGTLTVRGAQAAMVGLLSKIAAEPELRQQLRTWNAPGTTRQALFDTDFTAPEEPSINELLPVANGGAR